MTMRLVIGLHGLPRVGKDTIAEYLAERHGFTRLAFADELKEELAQAYLLDSTFLFNLDDKTWQYDRLELAACQDFKFVEHWMTTLEYAAEYRSSATMADPLKAPRSPRWLMQRYGDYRRSQNPNYFIDKVQDKIDVHPCSHIVISDVRYENEALMVKHHQPARIWHIRRPEVETVMTMRHSSNEKLDERLIDKTIVNSGSIEALRGIVNYLLETC